MDVSSQLSEEEEDGVLLSHPMFCFSSRCFASEKRRRQQTSSLRAPHPHTSNILKVQGGPGTGNRNRKPEPSEPFSQEPNAERNRFPGTKPEPEPSSLLNCTETHKNPPSLEEPLEPKTGTARTVPSPNRNRTEPNRGHPEGSEFDLRLGMPSPEVTLKYPPLSVPHRTLPSLRAALQEQPVDSSRER